MTGFEIEIFKSSVTVSDLLSFETFKLHFYLSMCVCACICLHATSHTWRLEINFWESVLSCTLWVPEIELRQSGLAAALIIIFNYKNERMYSKPFETIF